ncbi:RodZ domain-containing protein [Deinococcus aquaedulcis]|uniref:RodZ domain-containing protein n=1 Tax=Deinococcus aquaedulcis TaxID=2840455 RepID=UPI001C836DDA|nr:RodZ domain-containing protein [Deinococcus aquaedulcis]
MGFGSALKQAREAQGRTTQDVALHTKIRSDYLQALEDEQLHRLPERTFARSYLQRYARELGLDPAPLLAEFDRHLPLPPAPTAPTLRGSRRRRPVWPLVGAGLAVALLGGALAWRALQAPAATAEAPAPPGAVTTPPATPDPVPATVRLTVSSVPAGARVYLDNRYLGTTPVRAFPLQSRARAQLRVELTGRTPLKEAVALGRSRNLRATLGPAGQSSVLTDLNAPRKPQASAPKPSSPGSPTPAPAPSTSPVKVTFSGPSWTRVTDAQGRVLFEGIPAAGTVKGFATGVTIRAGNAAAVLVSVDGAASAPLGQAGQVVTRTF